jgi:hypothetical protein
LRKSRCSADGPKSRIATSELVALRRGIQPLQIIEEQGEWLLLAVSAMADEVNGGTLVGNE